jgi:cytochrome c oxidase assembly protein subunit 15
VVGYWLIGSAASVFGIVVFGGLTRLTESGYVGAAWLSWSWSWTCRINQCAG